MAIKGFDFDAFSETRTTYFHLAPIDQPQHLKGREKQIAQIQRNLDTQGRQIFIFGDRGVGKTSLARTAAYATPNIKFDPVYVACDREGSFFQMAAAIIDELAGRMDQSNQSKDITKASILTKVLGYERTQELTRIYPEFDSLSRFVQALKAITENESKAPLVIIDELERFDNSHDRGLMADFVKRVSDECINVKLILCGIASSISGLIGDHPSSERSFSPIHLKQLPYDNLQEIILAASEAFGVGVPKGVAQRISVISDGFPYFTQLIGEQLFWIIFEDQGIIKNCSEDHFQRAIDRSVEEANFTLREKYDRATLKYRNTQDFKQVLWSMVLSPTLSRQVSDVYEQSYLDVVRIMKTEKVLSSHEFNSRVWYLTQESHGGILTARGSGWYEFSERMMRGYVRLMAQAEGLNFKPDIHLSDFSGEL